MKCMGNDICARGAYVDDVTQMVALLDIDETVIAFVSQSDFLRASEDGCLPTERVVNQGDESPKLSDSKQSLP